MINRRLLIKNLLSHNDENSFFDKKEQLSLDSKEGKVKFIKHVCALSNSNPENESYMVIGVNDENNTIVGVDFFDDSKIQNLINAYLVNPPKIQYENVPFPRLPRYKVVGLVTIYPKHSISSLIKNAWKYKKGTIFYRRGSNSMPLLEGVLKLKNTNKISVSAIQKNAQNNIKLILDDVFDFMHRHKKANNPQYIVFKEQFVLCWSGKKSIVNDTTFYSRVDIELVNEQVRLFYSALDEVQITYNTHSFIIIEFIKLGLEKEEHYPLEKTIINFKDNGKYDIVKEYLFKPPQFDPVIMQYIYDNSTAIVRKIKEGTPLSVTEHEDVYRLPNNYLLCYLSGFTDSKGHLEEAKMYIKNLPDIMTYLNYKEVIRVLRKVTYH